MYLTIYTVALYHTIYRYIFYESYLQCSLALFHIAGYLDHDLALSPCSPASFMLLLSDGVSGGIAMMCMT